jgi:hypothetical protein
VASVGVWAGGREIQRPNFEVPISIGGPARQQGDSKADVAEHRGTEDDGKGLPCPLQNPVEESREALAVKHPEPSPDSQTQSFEPSQAVHARSQHAPSCSSPEKYRDNEALCGSPPHHVTFQLRLSNSSSSPSKSPGSAKLSQNGGLLVTGLLEQSQNGKSGDDNGRAPAWQEGTTSAPPLGVRRETPTPPANIFDGQISVLRAAEKVCEEGGRESFKCVLKLGDVSEHNTFCATEMPLVDRCNEMVPDGETVGKEFGEVGPSDRQQLQRPVLTGGEEKQPSGGPSLEPPLTYAGVWAHEPQWRGTASQPPSGSQSQSLVALKEGKDEGAEDRVPDSDETRSHSSGRGVNPGPTPPPSSPTCSSGGGDRRSGEGLLKGQSPDEWAGREKVEHGVPAEQAGKASQDRGEASGTESGETELVPETEEMDDDESEEGCDRGKAAVAREPALMASPCRASESPAVSGSQPLSQSQVF